MSHTLSSIRLRNAFGLAIGILGLSGCSFQHDEPIIPRANGDTNVGAEHSLDYYSGSSIPLDDAIADANLIVVGFFDDLGDYDLAGPGAVFYTPTIHILRVLKGSTNVPKDIKSELDLRVFPSAHAEHVANNTHYVFFIRCLSENQYQVIKVALASSK